MEKEAGLPDDSDGYSEGEEDEEGEEDF